MAKILVILMPDYRDEEFVEPYNILQQAGHTVDVAGLEPGTTTGSKGHEHTPNLQLADLTHEDYSGYDAVVIPGGPGSKKYLWGNEKIHDAVKYFHEQHKIIAAICYAVVAVVQTGILRNRHATVYPTDEAKAILEEYGVRFSKGGKVPGAGCVALAPEKIITAQGPKAATDFGKAIVSMLS